MKQKDIALIIVIAFISAIASFFISNKIFVTPSNRQQQVDDVLVVNADFSKPDSKYFNDKSINPAQLVQIGENNNTNPFNGTSQ